MGLTQTSPIVIPVLPGLDNLPAVVNRVVIELMSELPGGYTRYDLQFDLSNPQNWYRVGGHYTPSFDECLHYAKDYIRQAREKIKKPS